MGFLLLRFGNEQVVCADARKPLDWFKDVIAQRTSLNPDHVLVQCSVPGTPLDGVDVELGDAHDAAAKDSTQAPLICAEVAGMYILEVGCEWKSVCVHARVCCCCGGRCPRFDRG